MAKTYIIDGKNFSTLEEFFEEISEILIPGMEWGKNLNAFNDILYDWLDSDENNIVIRWKNSDISRAKLGYPETVRQLKMGLENCYISNRDWYQKEILAAEMEQGKTIFDLIIEIIKSDRPIGCFQYEIMLEQ